MKLNVPMISQPKNSNDCGIASVAMILKYYKVPFEYRAIKKEIGVFKEGTYAPQLSLFLLQQGFNVTIVTFHPALFNIGHSFKSRPALLNHIQKMSKILKGEWNSKAIKFFIQFVEAGGTISTEIPNEKTIKKRNSCGTPTWYLHDALVFI